MKQARLNARLDAALLDAAKKKAQQQNKTLTTVIEEALKRYVGKKGNADGRLRSSYREHSHT